MRRKSNFSTWNRAPDLRIRRSDVLQQSCSKFYGEPAEPLLRSNVTRVFRLLGLPKRNTSTDYDREVKLTRKLTPARFTLHEVESPSISV